ncbi:MAG: alpha/beta hydrolase, partial [Proteobacteria bacterium]|nr:alpha/beta hydrolase [Pseudomonadota bacterium]
MQSITFDGCRGWFHPGRGSRGVVLVYPHGLEALCVRQSYRILADRLAEEGLATLRFDLSGTGDSSGTLDTPRLAERWLGNIEAAARWLETNAGVTEIAFAGTRLGATLAAAAAEARGGVEQLVLLAPYASGRDFGREIRLTAQVVVTKGSEGAREASATKGVDVAGFITPETLLGELQRVDLLKSTKPCAAKILMLASTAQGQEHKLARHFTQTGAEVEVRGFAEFARLINEPTSNRPCLDAIEQTVAWLSGEREVAHNPAMAIAPPQSDVLEGEAWRETGLMFGPGNVLVGVLTEPNSGPRARQCAILLNGGRDCHIGWARGTVELARNLAAAGIASIRFDLKWIGDSQPSTEGRRVRLYDPSGPSGVGDVGAAIAEAKRRGFADLVLYGACSGAYLAFVAGLDD